MYFFHARDKPWFFHVQNSKSNLKIIFKKGNCSMKSITKILSLFLALTLLLSFPVAASAAELANVPTIDVSKTGSLTIYKYDLTNAEKDGVWDSSYVSTGVYDEAGVNNVLGGNASSTLGNGETGYGYAIKGVEFTYVKVADIFQYGETETTDGHVEVLYAVDKAKGADFLKALGLAEGKNRYENADALDESKYFYQSDVLVSALSSGLTANATTVKNAMERYAATNGTAMPLTDSYGKTKAENLPLGLYTYHIQRTDYMSQQRDKEDSYYYVSDIWRSGQNYYEEVTYYYNSTGETRSALGMLLRDGKGYSWNTLNPPDKFWSESDDLTERSFQLWTLGLECTDKTLENIIQKEDSIAFEFPYASGFSGRDKIQGNVITYYFNRNDELVRVTLEHIGDNQEKVLEHQFSLFRQNSQPKMLPCPVL